MISRSIIIFLFLLQFSLVGECKWLESSGVNCPRVHHYSEKLKKQWNLYHQAQLNLLNRIVQKSEQPISRDEWESWIKGDGCAALSESEKAQLKIDQQQRIQNAFGRFQKISPIHLNSFRRNSQAVARFCAALPKGGMLHIHPFGTMNLELGKRLLSKQNSPLNLSSILMDVETSGGNMSLGRHEVAQIQKFPQGLNYQQLSQLQQNQLERWMFLPPGFQLFPRFNTVFAFLNLAIQNWNDYQQVMFNFARRAVAEGVIYTEFTAGWSKEMANALETIERETGLVIRVNHSFNRTRSDSQLRQDLSDFLQQKPSPYLVGVDLLDNEEGHSALDKGQWIYGSLLLRSQRSSADHVLHRTQHAGEMGDLRNPRDAMLMGSERLGHAVELIRDPIALEYAVYKKQPLEINVSSNLRLTSIPSVKAHPILNYLRLGLPVSLSTDDEGIFEIDINHECEILIEQTDITYAELKEMAFNGIKTSFVEQPTRQRLLQHLEWQFQKFESSLK